MQSIPRVLSLGETPDGLRLIEQLAGELSRLRQPPFTLENLDLKTAAEAWGARVDFPETVEIRLLLEPGDALESGLMLRKGETQETAVGYDWESGKMLLDRRKSGRSEFHHGFAAIHRAPLHSSGDQVELHVFLAACRTLHEEIRKSFIFTSTFPATKSQFVGNKGLTAESPTGC